jgi:hypothetical protein
VFLPHNLSSENCMLASALTLAAVCSHALAAGHLHHCAFAPIVFVPINLVQTLFCMLVVLFELFDLCCLTVPVGSTTFKSLRHALGLVLWCFAFAAFAEHPTMSYRRSANSNGQTKCATFRWPNRLSPHINITAPQS